MSFLQVLSRAMDSGVTVRVIQGEVRVSGRVPADLKEKLLEHRQAIKDKLISGKDGQWSFCLLHIPSQRTPGQVDLWISGSRVDRAGEHVVWFVGERDA